MQEKREEEGRSPAPGGIQTHALLFMRHMLYRCAITQVIFLGLPSTAHSTVEEPTPRGQAVSDSNRYFLYLSIV